MMTTRIFLVATAAFGLAVFRIAGLDDRGGGERSALGQALCDARRVEWVPLAVGLLALVLGASLAAVAWLIRRGVGRATGAGGSDDPVAVARATRPSRASATPPITTNNAARSKRPRDASTIA